MMKSKKLESKFQKEVISEIKARLPDCIVLKNDPNYIQGIPDLTVLNGPRWAALEVKRESDASHRPNQDYYVDRMMGMSFAAFIFPENKDFIIGRMVNYLSKEDDDCVSMGGRLPAEETG